MKLLNWVFELPKQSLEILKDIAFFMGFVSIGSIAKMIREKQRTGRKITWKYVASEVIMSFFIGGIVYAIFDQFLDLKPLFTYAMCAAAGSMSSIFHDKLEDILSFSFEFFKVWIKQMFSAKKTEV